MSALAKMADRRLASLVVVAVVVLAAVVALFDTLAYWRAETAALDELEDHTLALEARAAAIAGATGADPGEATPDGRILVFGETPGLAAAEFQRVLTFIAERNGAVVRALDTPESQAVDGIADTDGNPLERVRLTMDLEVMEQELPDLLYAIETDFPVIIVDGLSLRGNRRIEGAGGDAWVAAMDRPLSMRLAVSGFRTGSIAK